MPTEHRVKRRDPSRCSWTSPVAVKKEKVSNEVEVMLVLVGIAVFDPGGTA